jgi:tRNA G18 (ribose-2'-O)-methylase SpoU
VRIREIHSLDLPELEPYRTLRRPQQHIARGIFVAEGEKVVRRLLDSGLTVLSILLTPAWLEQIRRTDSLESSEIFIGEKKLLETIVGYPLHQGIMAVARVPQQLSIGELLSQLPDPFLVVALDGIVNAENVGVIVRNAAAFGANGIIAGTNSSSPYLRRAVRNSMGAVFRMPVIHADLQEALEAISPHCRRIGALPGGDQSLASADFHGNLCLIFGNEGTGISDSILSLCDVRVAIPMHNNTDSLNVASAAAVFLYELARRREVSDADRGAHAK